MTGGYIAVYGSGSRRKRRPFGLPLGTIATFFAMISVLGLVLPSLRSLSGQQRANSSPGVALSLWPGQARSPATVPGQYTGAIRIGHGWDIHGLASRKIAGQPCVIGGVEVGGDELGVVAHSDGDVLYHSATDAILGALGLPDIGQLFPDNDPRLKGANSERFVVEAWKRMDQLGYRISNLDATLILEKPKVGKHIATMRANIARLLQTPLSSVNVKARTHEKVDAVGEGRALSCHVVVLIEKI